MLYHLYELNLAALTPVRLMAEAGMGVLRHPWNPVSYSRTGRATAAALDLFEQQTRRYVKPAFGLGETVVNGQSVTVKEEISVRKTFCQLKKFTRSLDGEIVGQEQPKLLIVAPLSGHFATLLRGTVEALLPHADVTITDWRDARLVPIADGAFSFDDYVDYIIDFLTHLHEANGTAAHVLAVCQPAVPVMAAVAIMAAQDHPATPKSMTLMGGPIDTRISPTVPNKLAKTHSLEWFERNVIHRVPPPYPGFMRRVYPGFLQLTGFMSMNWERHLEAHMRVFNHMVEGDGDSVDSHRVFYDEYRAVMDLPAEYYLDTVKIVFQEHRLPLGLLTHHGDGVDPSAITKTALMTIEGEKDDISAPGQTKAAHDLVTNLPQSMQEHYVQPGVGHYGVFNGRRWREEICPRFVAFMRAHDA